VIEEADSRPFPGSPAHREETAGSGAGPDVPVVVFVADDHFAMPLAAAITSVAANLGKGHKAHVFIVDGGISRTNKEKIMESENREQVKIQWLQPSESQCDLLRSLPCGYVGRTAYFKMLVPELLGPEYPRIIYLDCDVIVEADINALWDADLGENYALAVHDLINPFVSSPLGLRNWRELARKADDELFNTGVLVLNAAKWRKENVTLKLVQYLKDHYQYVQLCDQDAMNAVFRDKWGRLDSRWNVLPYMNIARNYCLLSKNSHKELLRDAYLLHFCGPKKPWNARCGHSQRGRFFHYLDMTAWSGWRPKWWAIDSDVFVYYMRRALSSARRRFGICNRFN
jgi:lipopolysaccharide biosynthesis glycosyltransferase